jgi:voltage-gated potassium channel
MGLGVLSMVTASVAALFVETEERQIERDLLHEISALRADVRALKARIDHLQDAGPASGA